MYPVLLTEDEILTLRLMLRTVISRRTLEACEEYKLKLKALLAEENSEGVDKSFVQKTLNIQDTYRNIDIILFQAQVKAAGKKQSVIIAMGEPEFKSLRHCAQQRYYTDNVSDPASLETADRIVRNQDSIKLSFENAEMKAKLDDRPTQPVPPPGLMN
jgi:hypothetical protein